MKQKKKTSIVGRRTGVNIVPKEVKLNKHGFENFGNYWQSLGSSLEVSPCYMNSSPIDPNVQRISTYFVKNVGDTKSERISFINPSCLENSRRVGNSPKQPFEKNNLKISSNVTNKLLKSRKTYTTGRRTGFNIAQKEIQMGGDIEDFKDYWSATESEFDDEVDGTNNNKMSISRRLLRSDTKLASPGQKSIQSISKLHDYREREINANNSKNSDSNSMSTFSKAISKSSSTENLIEGRSAIATQVNLADSDVQSSPSSTSEITPQKNITICNRTPSHSPSLGNSNISTDCNNSERNPIMSSLLTPKAPLNPSLKHLFSSKKNIRDSVQEKIVIDSSRLHETTFGKSSPKFVSPNDVNRTITKQIQELTQTIANDTFSKNSPKAVSFDQSAKTLKSSDSKSRKKKGKKTLTASKNRDKTNRDFDSLNATQVNLPDSDVQSSPSNTRKSTRQKNITIGNITPSSSSLENSIISTDCNNSKRTPIVSNLLTPKAPLNPSLSCLFSNKKDVRDSVHETTFGKSSPKLKFTTPNDVNRTIAKRDKILELAQTIANDTFSKNSPKSVSFDQSAKTLKSTDSKSRKKKGKKTLTASKNKDKTMNSNQNKKSAELINTSLEFKENNKTSTKVCSEIGTVEGTFSDGLAKEISSNQIEKSLKFCNSKPKTKKRKSPLSTVSSLNNVETEGSCSEMFELRRSKRERIAPLETWRLERRVFGYKNGEIVNLGYEQGFPKYKTEVGFLPRKQKTTENKKNFKRKSVKLNDNTVNMELIKSSINKIGVTNPYTGEEEPIYLYRPYNTLLWSVPPSLDEKDPPYVITKSMSGELISFGYIEIKVAKKKEEQFSPADNITFTIVRGKVKICINKQELKLKELDKITVPSSNGYSIENTGKIPALLSFCTYKVPLFDYQFSENLDEAA